ncbi:unnamed protein product [Mycena citricolor]|uniref:Uncharacterized protein n=1 Tax=Mycena citricolor TaxID=2018698 RepID=A0AAD2GVK7_9AGAR|nr:unnamed protein product [Mycena citricolor]CAK5280714.1 unnamed protein product [Mycena citricolor]
MQLLLPLLAVLSCVIKSRGNTEIVNFHTDSRSDVPALPPSPLLPAPSTANWVILPAQLGTPRSQICVTQSTEPCPHELWYTLDLDSSHSRYTLRISYAASFPTDFFIDILSPEEAAAVRGLWSSTNNTSPSAETRRRYARIRAVDTGVRTPQLVPFWPYSVWTGHVALSAAGTTSVPFTLTLEPLLLGALPAGLVPFLFVAAVVLGVLIWGVLPPVLKAIQSAADDVNRDVRADKKSK